MLTKPDLNDEVIIECLRDSYGLNVNAIAFLPLGADFNTAVYRITSTDNNDYFLKLRRDGFSEVSVAIPKYLADIGFQQVIAPIATTAGQLWANLESFKAILYSYIEGSNGVDRPLSDQQWFEFGKSLKKFHNTIIPKTISNNIPKENFSDQWRNKLKTFLQSIADEICEESVAAATADFLKAKSAEILIIIKRTEALAHNLKAQNLDYVLCHADIHGWNLLIAQNADLYIVDWDTLTFAPKERDLMFIGAGISNTGRSSIEEEALFYQGYGQTNINKAAIAYYRYERVIQDIFEYCEQILLSNAPEAEKIQSFEYLKVNFLPNSTIERALQTNMQSVSNI